MYTLDSAIVWAALASSASALSAFLCASFCARFCASREREDVAAARASGACSVREQTCVRGIVQR